MEDGLAKFTKRFFSGTLLSRISGLGRDLAMAFSFGDHPSIAAFMVAFRLSNLFRRLLGEGPLQSAFIPHFEGLRSKDNAAASFFFNKLVIFLTLLILGITVLTEAGLGAALFFGDLSEGNREIIHLTQLLFPGLLFICLYGLNISFLNCHDSFFIPSFAPFICNGIWIVAALLIRHHDPSIAMVELSTWVVVGFAAQWLLTFPLTLRFLQIPWREWLVFKVTPEIKQLFKSFSLGAIGVGAVQINSMTDPFFARYADIRGPTYLWYSIRLEQLAFAVFGIVCVTTIAPRLSRAIKNNLLGEAQSLFSLSYRRIMAIMIPCTFAIAVLGLSAVNLVYGRGSFSEVAVVKTNLCLLAYGLGLIPAALILLTSTLFYARDNFRTPMLVSVGNVALNLVMNYVFVFMLDFGTVSTALTTSLCAWINYVLLIQLAKREGWEVHYALSNVIKVSFVSVVGAACALTAGALLFGTNLFGEMSAQPLPRELLLQLLQFGVELSAFLAGFVVASVVFKVKDVLEIVQFLRPTQSSAL